MRLPLFPWQGSTQQLHPKYERRASDANRGTCERLPAVAPLPLLLSTLDVRFPFPSLTPTPLILSVTSSRHSLSVFRLWSPPSSALAKRLSLLILSHLLLRRSGLTVAHSLSNPVLPLISLSFAPQAIVLLSGAGD